MFQLREMTSEKLLTEPIKLGCDAKSYLFSWRLIEQSNLARMEPWVPEIRVEQGLKDESSYAEPGFEAGPCSCKRASNYHGAKNSKHSK